MRTLTRRIGTVKEVSRFMKISAARNSFHELMNANSATVTIAGTARGRKMRVKRLQAEQPSIIAASSISRGIDSKLLRMRKTEKGSCRIVCTIATPRWELIRTTLAKSRDSGVSGG